MNNREAKSNRYGLMIGSRSYANDEGPGASPGLLFAGHQADRVTERLKFTRPIMRRCTGLDANQARWQLLKERQNISSLELTAHNDIAIRIDAMNLEH